MMQHLSSFLARAFSPVLTPTYGIFLSLWVSVLSYQALSTRITVLFAIFGITVLLPAAIIRFMLRLNIFSSHQLDDRRERTYPYLCIIACYFLAVVYIMYVHAPLWLTAFTLGGTIACATSLLINFAWKISAHTTGMGGIVALLFFLHRTGLDAFNSLWLFCLAIILAGVIGTIRIYQGKHTLLQVLAGFANGCACVHYTISFFY